MKTFYELRENLTNKDWSKDSKAVKNSKDPKFISAMINKWGERGGAWLGHPALKNEDYNQGLDELSTNTLGSYAKKALQRGDIASRMSKSYTAPHQTNKGMEKIADKRGAGAALAVKKLGKKTGSKSYATRTSNNIKRAISLGKDKHDPVSNDKANKSYTAAQRGIIKLWDKGAKR